MDEWPLGEIKRTVVGERVATIAGRHIPYLVYRWIDPSPDPLAANDRGGTIYVSERVVQEDARHADLTALHEQVELEREAKGRPHAYAHRRAFVEELLTARRLYGQPADVEHYVRWKVEQYPPWKVFDRQVAIARLSDLLIRPVPKRGDLLRVIAAYPL